MIKKIQKFNRKVYKLLKNETVQLVLLGILFVLSIYGWTFIILYFDWLF